VNLVKNSGNNNEQNKKYKRNNNIQPNITNTHAVDFYMSFQVDFDDPNGYYEYGVLYRIHITGNSLNSLNIRYVTETPMDNEEHIEEEIFNINTLARFNTRIDRFFNYLLDSHTHDNPRDILLRLVDSIELLNNIRDNRNTSVVWNNFLNDIANIENDIANIENNNGNLLG
jgi:hypothetical protein